MQQEKLRIPAILQNGQRTQKTKKFFGRIFSKRRDLKSPTLAKPKKEQGPGRVCRRQKAAAPTHLKESAHSRRTAQRKSFSGAFFQKGATLKSLTPAKPKEKQGPGRACRRQKAAAPKPGKTFVPLGIGPFSQGEFMVYLIYL